MYLQFGDERLIEENIIRNPRRDMYPYYKKMERKDALMVKIMLKDKYKLDDMWTWYN